MDNGGFSIQDAMRFANSDAGKQLFALLQQTRSQELNSAMEQASKGDMAKTKAAMQSLIDDPRVKQLLRQVGEKNG